jgi:hypothetical protein
MSKSFAQAMFEAEARQFGMSERQAEKAVTEYMNKTDNARAKEADKKEDK